MQQDVPQYGVEDASFRAAGGQEGIFRLVDEFYVQMDTLEEARTIRAMHPEDISGSADKLARFLCGWLGGPKLYREKYGSIHIPQAHKPFDIGCDERDAWLLCMRKALEQQPYEDGFKTYLLEQLWRPAERSRTRD
ncbi:group II truncated hemoglobin [Aliamphritea hakodatensis]|uniref:group II truncated hemoglobin n=1 Tax=Aliamphritea hakodatensis TaxID=2895352 RepID=UPI0022FD5725|nr:group II truncated hemoglobin [Aliamphritea hakodatensis]